MKQYRFYFVTGVVFLFGVGIMMFLNQPRENLAHIPEEFLLDQNCEEFRDPEQERQCDYWKEINQFISEKNLRPCVEKFTGEVVTNCIWKVAEAFGKMGEPLSICDQLEEKIHRGVCRTRLKGGARKIISYQDDLSLFDDKYEKKDLETFNNQENSPVATPFLWEEVYLDNSIVVASTALSPRNTGELPFTRMEASEIGVSKYNEFSAIDFRDPFVHGRGIAAGDYTNDGWDDLVIAGDGVLHLYQNENGQFNYQGLNFERLEGRKLFLVAFVDINNDGWQDLFTSAYGGEAFFFLNEESRFSNDRVQPGGQQQTILMNAATFGDVNQDGLLDFYAGNWSKVKGEPNRPGQAFNRLLIQEEGGFTPLSLDPFSTQTHSVLFSDFSGDRVIDLMVGNDFEAPDLFYENKNGSFSQIQSESDIISQTPFFTMSYDTGDINNDLRLDLFADDLGDLSTYFGDTVIDSYCDFILNADERERCKTNLDLREALFSLQMENCLDFDGEERNNCLEGILVAIADQLDDTNLCQKISEESYSILAYCHHGAQKGFLGKKEYDEMHIEQVQENRLLLSELDGTFSDVTEQFGVETSRWSWNAKFADLDNDGWQDLYIGNGYRFNINELDSNIFFHNQNGKRFQESQEEFGLEDYLHTPSYVYTDYDRDGDLDIIALGMNAPPRVFRNNDSQFKSILLQLNDKQGNFFGIGSQVIVTTKNGASYLREVKSGGGFMSFDAPILHFGLADEEEIASIEVYWSTGEKSIINNDFSTNLFYRIERK